MSSSPSPTGASNATTPISSPSSPNATPFDRLFVRLDKAFPSDAKRRDAKLLSTSSRLDDSAMDMLFEVERYLASPAKADCSRYHSALLKLLLERATLRCGESGMSRVLVSHVLLLLMELNSNSLSHVYSDVLQLMQHREQSQRLAGLSMFAVLVQRFGQQFLLNQTDVVQLLSKLSKRDEVVVKELLLTCISAIYIGTGGPRSTDSNSLDLLKVVQRLSDKSSEKSLRCASAHCIDVIVKQSSDGRELQTVLPICVKALLDSDLEVRFINADTLGRILAYCTTKDLSRLSEAARRVRLKYEIKTVDDALDTIHKLFATAPHYKLKASLSVCLTRLMLCSVGAVEDGVMSGYVMTIIGFVFKTSGPDSEREGRQLAACIGDAIVTGILSRQRERGLEMIARSITQALHANNSSNELNEYQIMVACECLSFIFNRLSSALEHMDIKDTALDVLLFLLTSSSHSLRLHAAQTFRCLARAASSHIATWLSVVEKIIAIQLSEVLDGGRGKEVATADPYWSLHGHMSALSAVVGVIPECTGGVSLAMLDSVFEVSKRLICVEGEGKPMTIPAWQLNECGWTLLASLIGLGSEWVAPRLNALFTLWRNVLGKSPPTTPQAVQDIASDLRVRGKALVALRSFAHVMRHRIAVQGQGQFSPVLKATRVFLCTNFSLVKALQSAKDLEPVIVSALCTVKPVLMDLFTAIPPSSFTSYFSRILKFIVAEFTSGNPPASTELNRLLNPADHTLLATPSAEPRMSRFIDLHRPVSAGALVSRGRDDGDSPDDAAFVCIEPRTAGGTIAVDYSWNWCLRPDSYTYSQMVGEEEGREHRGEEDEEVTDVEGINRSHNVSYSRRNNSDHLQLHAFECFEHSALRSCNAGIRLFAAIYADQSSTYKEQLMKHLHALVNKHKQAGSLHLPAVTNIATALLAVCRDQAQRELPIGAPNALQAMVSIATDLLAAPSPLVRRAAGEVFGLLVHLEDDAFLTRITSVLRDQLASKDVNVLCAAVFAYGCVHRYGGGMKTIRALTFTVASLQLMGRDFTEPLRLWILHALWLTVETGGLSFSAYAQPTLSIVWSHAMHDCEAPAPLLTLTIGRILHAVIAALGPEVSQAAAASASSGLGVERFLNLYSHLQGDAHSSVQVQVIETANQLVLWNAIGDEERLLMLLVGGLESEEEELRRCSVKCLLRWGEKDAKVVSKAGMAGRLLALMDRETSHHILILIRHAINAFIKLHSTKEAVKPGERPTRWYLLDTLKRAMVGGSHKLPSDGTGASGAGAAEGTRGKDREKESKGGGGDDDEDEEGIMGSSPPQKSSASAASASPSPSGPAATTEFRWQTKAFALDSLSHLLQTVKASALPAEFEFDLASARKTSTYSTQFLVQQLVDLLTVACMATSSSYDCLRIKGTIAMLNIVLCYQDVIDPDGEGELLLQLYSAQVTSALTASMKNKSEAIGSAPQLRAAACELCTVYLVSGVTDDEMVVQRTLRMLLTPLQRPADVQLWYAQYDGNMATMVLLAHLSALCQLQLATRAVASSTSSGKRKKKQPRQLALQLISTGLQPHFGWLQQQYLLALRDHATVLVTQKKDLQRSKGHFFDGATATRVMDVFAPVWAVFLQATAEVGMESSDSDAGVKDQLLLVSVVLSTLHSIFAYEVLAVQRHKAVDTSVSEQEREREQKQVLACMQALPALLTPTVLSSPSSPFFDLLAELLPLLSWALQHRLVAEPSIVQPRQLAAAAVLTSVIDSLHSLLTSNPLPSLPPSSSSLPELLHALSESVFTSVYQHLPLSPPDAPSPSSGAGGGRSTAEAGRRALAAADVEVGDEALKFLSRVLALVPRLASVWLVGAQAQRKWQQTEGRREKAEGEEDGAALPSPLSTPLPFPPSVYLCALVELCLHVTRQGSLPLASVAQLSLKGVVVAFALSSGARLWPSAFDGVARPLLEEVRGLVRDGEQLSSAGMDFRMVGLLEAGWWLAAAPAAPSSDGDDFLTAQSTTQPVNGDLLRMLAAAINPALASARWRSATLQLLLSVVFAADPSPASAVLYSASEAAAAVLFPFIAPSLLSLLHSSTEHALSLQVARVLHAAATFLSPLSSVLLPLVLPCLIHSLSVSPDSLSVITALATSFPAPFKQLVGGLSVELRTKLQTAALQAQHTQPSDEGDAGTTEGSAGGAGGGGTDGAEGRSTKERGKGKKKKRTDSGGLNPDDAISLSTDFSSFAKKKGGG